MYLKERDAERLWWNEPVEVTMEISRYTYQGQVSFISPEAQPPATTPARIGSASLVRLIRIDIENPRHELRPGPAGDVTIRQRTGAGPK
jgi:HlyD family secretion protein